MSENRVHKIVKILMVAVILLLAYFLPGICARRMGGEESVRGNREKILEKGEQKDTGTITEGETGIQGTGGQENDPQRKNPGGEGKGQQPGGGALIVLDPGHGGL